MNSKFKSLWDIGRGTRLSYFMSWICLIISAIFLFLIPQIFSIGIDIIKNKQTQDIFFYKIIRSYIDREFLLSNMYILAGLIVGFTIISGFFAFLHGKLSSKAAEKVSRNLRNNLYNHMQKLPIEFHDQSETGDLVQRCTSDIETIRMFLQSQLPNIARVLVMVTFAMMFMLPINLKMGLISLSCIPVILTFSLYFFSKVGKTFKNSDEAEGAMTAVIQENLTNIQVVKAFARKDYEIDKFSHYNKDYRNKWYRLIQILSIYWSVSDVFCLGQIAAVMYFGVGEVKAGNITPGELFSFSLYINLFIWPMRNLGRTLSDMGKTFVSIDRVEYILHENEEKNPPQSIEHKNSKGKMEFRNVSFKHRGKSDDTISNISFTVEPGETIAIVGPSGTGKSTIINLMLKLYQDYEGEILMDDIHYKKLTNHDVRKQFGTVLQEPFLFSRTISENIKFGRISASHEEVEKAVAQSSLEKSIEKFEQGYETMVGERGITLSGGQRQRVAIARALMMETPFLILDDALSAVDMQTEQNIIKAIKKRAHKQTTIVIAHRISSLKHADKILVIENGRITQIGNHHQLANQPGLYQRLWQVQFELEEELRKELAK